jgi:hypothetical protein
MSCAPRNILRQSPKALTMGPVTHGQRRSLAPSPAHTKTGVLSRRFWDLLAVCRTAGKVERNRRRPLAALVDDCALQKAPRQFEDSTMQLAATGVAFRIPRATWTLWHGIARVPGRGGRESVHTRNGRSPVDIGVRGVSRVPLARGPQGRPVAGPGAVAYALAMAQFA